jgi:hypothetical protein
MFGENRGWVFGGEMGGATMDDVEKLHQKVRPRREQPQNLQRRVEARRTNTRDAIIVPSLVTPTHFARASLNLAKNAIGPRQHCNRLPSVQSWWRMR